MLTIITDCVMLVLFFHFQTLSMEENKALKAKIQGLEYENKMFKQLLDNLFKHGVKLPTSNFDKLSR